MKKVLYSLLTLAAALTVTSCLKEVEGGAVYDDGTFVDATFSVVLGPQTKAYADGTTVNQLYAGLYEVDDVDNPTSFTYVAHTENPINISGKKAQVSFDGKLKRGKIYAVVFWAQKNGAPYVLDWGENVTTGPFITIGRTGYANDETRDAFTAMDSFGPVTEAIVRDETHAVQLMRPFAQVNILVPNANVDETENLVAGDRVSGMTIAGLPNVLNLATAEVSSNDGGQDYVFTNANITEAAFGNFASGYQYMAMNYVPYGADLNANYQVTFSVINKSQTADNKVVNVPLKPNVRTNIVGNIFAEEFNYSAWAVVMPEPGELTSISLAVGTQGESAQNPVVLASVGATASVHPIISRDVTNETPTITVAPASVATASWNNQTGNVDITAQATGTAVITVVFPAVTKTSYAEGSIKLYVSVSGTDPAPTTYTVTLSGTPDANGNTFSASKTTGISEGEEITLTATPATGYSFVSWTVTTASSGTVTVENDTFSMPAENVTVSATFALIPAQTYAVDLASMTNGSVVANPNSDVPVGATVNLTVNPVNDNFRLKPNTLTYKINGESDAIIISGNSFEMPAGNVTIYAEFEYKYEWVVTNVGSLATNDVLVIVSKKESDIYALSSNQVNNKGNAAVSISYSDGKLNAVPDSKLVWVVTVNNNQFEFATFDDTDKKWYCTNDNNGLRVGVTDLENATLFTYTDNYLKNVGQTRYVGVYNNADWRSYTTINNNISGQEFVFFKRTEKQ